MTKKISNKKLSFVFLIVFLSIFCFSHVLAACVSGDPCSPEGSTCSCSCGGCSDRYEYKCVTDEDCGVEIRQRAYSQSDTGHRTCGSCNASGTDCTWGGCGSCSGCTDSGGYTESHHSNCPVDKICQLNGDVTWISSVPNCEYLSPPTNGQQEDGNSVVSSNNVYLPTKFNWADVRGAKSYLYRIWKATTTLTTWEQATIKTSGSTTISETKLPSCTLNSSTSFAWKISPCCYADRTYCLNWDDVNRWSFITNMAPELISPFDPDWNNASQWAVDVAIPVTLDWCDVEEAGSYKLKLYTVSGGTENCHPLLLKSGVCTPEAIEDPGYPSSLPSTFEDIRGTYFLRDMNYRWEVATCYASSYEEICSDFGHMKWGFDTTSTLPGVEFKLLSPPNNSVVGLPVQFTWNFPFGMQSYIYEFETALGPTSSIVRQTSIILDYPLFNANGSYRWRVRPCSNPDGTNCENWTSRWRFTITGARPSLNTPNNNATDVVIPARFDWDDVESAGSYQIQFSKDNFATLLKEFVIPKSEFAAPNSEITIDDPVLEMSTQYWWRVRTCAHSDGTVCGNWSNPIRRFTTFQIQPPNNLLPNSGALINTDVFDLSWDAVEGAKAYQYIIYDPDGTEIINKIILSNSARHYSTEFLRIDAPYTWKVQSCLDANCSPSKVSGYTALQNFQMSFVAPPESRGGLIPCGRIYEDPDTPCPPFCERDKCQIHHLFILLRNILEFLLFKVAFILMILLSFVAGLFFYISKGDANVIFKVRSLMKAAAIGFLIILFSWLVINLFLSAIGFKFQLFGHWWELPL